MPVTAFDAKVSEPLAELRAELHRAMDIRFKGIEQQLARIERRIGENYVSTIDLMFMLTVGSASMVLVWIAVGWLTGQ